MRWNSSLSFKKLEVHFLCFCWAVGKERRQQLLYSFDLFVFQTSHTAKLERKKG